jgi:hypothetical protein
MEEINPNPFNQSPFDFPERLLDQISECSPNGFLLFTISEDGKVELFTKPTSSVVDAGLRANASKILTAFDMIEGSEITSSLFPQPPHTLDADNDEEEMDDEGDSV